MDEVTRLAKLIYESHGRAYLATAPAELTRGHQQVSWDDMSDTGKAMWRAIAQDVIDDRAGIKT